MQLTIEKLIYGGDGLARLPAADDASNQNLRESQGRGKAVFVPFVLEGEAVGVSLTERKPGFSRGIAAEIVSPSPERIEPGCEYFKRCGGCHYQHSNYRHQLEIKAAILRENLRRIGKIELDVDLHIHPSLEWGYRNRSRFTVRFQPEFALCYHKFNSHDLLPVEHCPISSPLINQALRTLWEMGSAGEVPLEAGEIEFFSNADETAVLIEAYFHEEISAAAMSKFFLNCQTRTAAAVGMTGFCRHKSGGHGVLEHEFASVGETQVKYKTAKSTYQVSSGSFFQVNRHLIDELVNIVTKGGSGDTALDLYAGVGLFSSVLNRDFQRVIAVESSQTSYSDLVYNSAPNVKPVRAMTEQYLANVAGKLRPDLVVVDPPRAGLNGAVLNSLIAMKSPHIAYVSCDPATAARDIRGFLNSGYRNAQAHLIDLFPQTFHIESVFHLAR